MRKLMVPKPPPPANREPEPTGELLKAIMVGVGSGIFFLFFFYLGVLAGSNP